MKADPTSTFNGAFLNDVNAQRFRNQATGVSPCLSESEMQGARRSRQVIDAAPVAQLRVKDRSYPAPGPVCDPLTGKLYDKVTGKPYKVAPLEGASMPGLWTRQPVWCHWCRKANHDDAQCFSTRPADWRPKPEDREPVLRSREVANAYEAAFRDTDRAGLAFALLLGHLDPR